jgi:hypothetical protein
LTHLAAPQGAHTEGTGAAALCPYRCFISPLHPLKGALRIAYAPAGKRLCHSCLRGKAGRRRAPWASSQHGRRPATGSWVARSASAPLRALLPLCMASHCTAAGLLRQGPASRHSPAGRPPRAGRQREQEGGPGGPRCGWTAIVGPLRAGGQAAHARAGRGAGGGRWTVWGQRAPSCVGTRRVT